MKKTETSKKREASTLSMKSIKIFGQPLTEGEPLAEGFVQEPNSDYGLLIEDLAKDTVDVKVKKKMIRC